MNEMKSKMVLLIKIGLILVILMKLPIQNELLFMIQKHKQQLIQNTMMDQILHNQTNLKQQLCYFDELPSSPKISQTKEKTTTIKKVKKMQQVKNNKSIYIYSTHQEEAYQDKGTVVEASHYLQSLLQEMGYEVLVEERKINDYLNQHQLTYNESYQASYYYLNDTLQTQSFDLIIDFHRDSIERSLSVFNDGKKQYAKLMFVIGGSNENVTQLETLATNLRQCIDAYAPGIMRYNMTREPAYYNQHVSNQMVLIEVGSETNQYQEVLNSIELIAKGINDYLMGKKV